MPIKKHIPNCTCAWCKPKTGFVLSLGPPTIAYIATDAADVRAFIIGQIHTYLVDVQPSDPEVAFLRTEVSRILEWDGLKACTLYAYHISLARLLPKADPEV